MRRPRPLDLALYGEGPLIALGVVLFVAARQHELAVDLRGAFLPAAHAVLHGASPFPTHAAVLRGTAYVYPPLVAYLLTPLLALPAGAAAWLATFVLVALVAVALRALGVADWRCAGLMLLWKPTLFAVQTANLSIPLLLAAALAWRYRDRRGGAIAAGAAVAAKLFLWPLLLWLVVTRRFRLAGWAAGTSAVLVVVPWAMLGFKGLSSYATLSRFLAHVEGPRSYTLVALAQKSGLGATGAGALGLAAGLVVLAVAVRAGLRGDDRLAFGLSIVAALLLTPVVWLHYFVLAALPIGLYRRRLDAVWFLPLALWLCPAGSHGIAGNGAPWQIALTVSMPLLCLGGAHATPRRRGKTTPVVDSAEPAMP